jgi:AcrR family transcriptional regulator
VPDVTATHPASDLTPKTAKGNRTRALLKASARDVFGRQGFTSARVSDITTGAQMSSGIFYRYYADKDAVRDELLSDLLSDVVSFARESWEPADPMRSVLRTTEKYLSFYRDNRDLYKIMIEVAQHQPRVRAQWIDAREEFYRRIGRMLRRAQDQGVARSDMDCELAAVLLGGMTEYYAYMWFVEERSSDLDIAAVAAEITNLWERGAFGIGRLSPPVEHA